jgi:hypothetical protein
MQPQVRASPPHDGQEVLGRFVVSPALSLPAPNLKEFLAARASTHTLPPTPTCLTVDQESPGSSPGGATGRSAPTLVVPDLPIFSHPAVVSTHFSAQLRPRLINFFGSAITLSRDASSACGAGSQVSRR